MSVDVALISWWLMTRQSGFDTVQHFSLFKQTKQPPPPNNRDAIHAPNFEPAYVQFQAVHPKFDKYNRLVRPGSEYIIFWYVGQLAADAKWTKGTGMSDEQSYTADLYTFEEAIKLLERVPDHMHVVRVVQHLYKDHLQISEDLRKEEENKRMQVTVRH